MIGHLKKLLSHRNPLRLGVHRLRAFKSAVLCGFPARKLIVIGVTGTDGKTTTVGMITHILRKQGIAVGALSTAFFQINDEVQWNATQKTSPPPFAMQKFLRTLVDRGCTHAVLEYSSHGLLQGRTLFTWPRVAAITNTSLEHLDYHGTMDRYRRDKGILFRMLGGRGIKVLNADDGSYGLYRGIPSKKTVTYSVHAPESSEGTLLWMTRMFELPAGAEAILHAQVEEQEYIHPLRLKIPGAFNLENAMCAVGCAIALSIDFEKAAEALSDFTGVPGRMEKIDEGQPFSVYVDFTVTPVAYEKTLKALRALTPKGKRILVLTGSCGDRMREKRPLVGKVCGELADVVVVTNEDPYTEDPQKIIDEVWSGIDQSCTEAHRIFDRLEAIKFIFSKAGPGDSVILCAKGSDTTMWVRDGQIPWNEREIARETLRQLRP